MATRLVVEHSGYGCECDCCGHQVTVEIDDVKGRYAFDFRHPEDASTPEVRLAYAKGLAAREFPDLVRDGAEVVVDERNPVRVGRCWEDD